MSKSTLSFAFICFFCFKLSHALNPIHDAGYALIPKGKNSSRATVALGVHFYARENNTVLVPFSATWELSQKWELGAGLKSQWGDVSSHIPHLALGFKFQGDGSNCFMGDFLLPTSESSDPALRFGYLIRRGFNRFFSYRGQLLLGFLDGLTEQEAPLALEFGFYPTLRLFGPYSFELGLIGSSQLKQFESHFSLDLQPAFSVNLGGDETFLAGVTLGLAGDKKTNLRVNFSLVHAF